MKTKKYLVVMILVLGWITARGQHEHHQMNADTTKEEKHSSHEQKPVVSESHSQHSVEGPPMTHAYSLNLPMNRNGSGTGWLPDLSPMYGYMVHSKKWMYMFHGNIFVRYTSQDVGGKGTRGDSKIDAPNWFMAMAQRRVGERGLLHFSSMFSLDPLFGFDGYPLLFQTGETYRGKPLVDRQHPHNLFSELSVSYTQSFTKDFDAFVYLGYPGEPALGPVAFMHRPSSLNMPDSPLGHHWQDATHITFGVVTGGIRYKIVKVDGSVFTGREPGERRYGFDKPLMNSYSYRLTVNPSPSLSAQVSRAHVVNPENREPAENVRRTTASVSYSLPLNGENSFFTSAIVYGFNDSGEDHKEHSFTLEGNLQLNRFAVYGRFENIEKSAEELQVDFDHHELFKINALTAGANYTFMKFSNTNLAFGVQGTIYSADERLDAVYGNNPASAEIYLRVSPGLMNIKK
jgi:hypothetical protein